MSCSPILQILLFSRHTARQSELQILGKPYVQVCDKPYFQHEAVSSMIFWTWACGNLLYLVSPTLGECSASLGVCCSNPTPQPSTFKVKGSGECMVYIALLELRDVWGLYRDMELGLGLRVYGHLASAHLEQAVSSARQTSANMPCAFVISWWTTWEQPGTSLLRPSKKQEGTTSRTMSRV